MPRLSAQFIRRIAPLAIAVTILAAAPIGCISTETTGGSAAPTTRVDFYDDPGDVLRAHSVLGEITASTTPGMPIASVRPTLLEQARRRGADAVAIVGTTDRVVGYRIDRADGGSRFVSVDDADGTSGTPVREQVVTARLITYTP